MTTDKQETARYDIQINRSWCKNCRICTLFCSNGVYKENELGGPVIVSPEKCTNCRLCVVRCPDFAIEVRSAGEKKEAGIIEKFFGKK